MARKTTEQFIEQAKIIHGDKYDYSKTVYQNCKNKVCIICNNVDEFGNIHGEFWQTPDNHINSKQGCPKCAKNIQLTTGQFIAKSKLIHGDKFIYDKVNYINNSTNVIIICPKHGEFKQLPLNHLKGEGCYKCGREAVSLAKKVDKEESIEKAKTIHNNYYDYSLVNFNKTTDKVIIICPIHGKFEQIMNNHLRGQGCPLCCSSKGEKSIIKWLNSNNINFISQFKIDIDININKSGYAYIDFYLPDYNCFIEYNGEQHYVAKERFGGQIGLIKQQKRDQFIREYCINNNIKLIEIKFNENINEKLNNLINYD